MPSGEENGRVVEGPFLCEAYAITRWVPGLGFKQPLSLGNLALVVPDDSRLPFASDERDFLLSLAGNDRRVTRIPANYLEVGTSLASGQYDGWHFTGHGAARNDNPDRSAMVLEEGEEFTPKDVSGEVTNLRNGQPLVFLNACQIGRGGMSLTGIGGWARRFVDAGAGAFIGAYWNVYDRSAFDFAQALYDRLLAGKTIGEAVKEARGAIRGAIRGAEDPTWLAYTVYADPSPRPRHDKRPIAASPRRTAMSSRQPPAQSPSAASPGPTRLAAVKAQGAGSGPQVRGGQVTVQRNEFQELVELAEQDDIRS